VTAAVTILCGVAILVGLIGIVVPLVPGLLLELAAVAVWAIFIEASAVGWVILALCVGWTAVGIAVKYLWPGRRIKAAGVPTTTMLAGVGLALVGFFAIPVVGVVVGFLGGIWLAEVLRLGGFGAAWPSTIAAVKAVGLSMAIELSAGVLVAGTWIVGVLIG
jgi:uncharacterized protein YqgC (DUF456 family)